MPLNGNRFKGNTQKKGKKNPFITDFDANLDRYAQVVDKKGGTQVEVAPIDANGQKVYVRIPGKFYKKVWFNRGDIVVITKVTDNMEEIKGKAPEHELNKLKNQFDKMNLDLGDVKNIVKFAESDDDSDESDDDDENDNKKKGKRVIKIPPQMNRNFDIDINSEDSSKSNNGIDVDDI